MVVDTLVDTFGPFMIPAILFVLGGIVYVGLVILGRRGLFSGDAERDPDGRSDDPGRND